LADWSDGGALARIADFSPGEDELVVVYDPATHPDPQLTLVSLPGSSDATVMLDGLPVAELAGGAGLDAGLFRLMPMVQAAA
jgi:hypothetical protein